MQGRKRMSVSEAFYGSDAGNMRLIWCIHD